MYICMQAWNSIVVGRRFLGRKEVKRSSDDDGVTWRQKPHPVYCSLVSLSLASGAFLIVVVVVRSFAGCQGTALKEEIKHEEA